MRLSSYSTMPTSTKQSQVSSSLRHDVLLLKSLTGAITAKFRSSGQACICPNRIYVQSSVYAEFASRLAEKVAAFRVGNGLDEQR
jgi:acyl-CoA reductase-like NAD-dependent aldehyde dehydrogenase